jgi:AraC-like DNA-binding protein
VRSETIETRRRLYLLARVVVARHYRRQLTLEVVAAAVSSSPRQLQRAYAQFGEITFKEELLARRMTIAAELLIEQQAIPVRDVARLVGYRQAPHFARAFRRRYGLSPACFREQGISQRNPRPKTLDLSSVAIGARSEGFRASPKN